MKSSLKVLPLTVIKALLLRTRYLEIEYMSLCSKTGENLRRNRKMVIIRRHTRTWETPKKKFGYIDMDNNMYVPKRANRYGNSTFRFELWKCILDLTVNIIEVNIVELSKNLPPQILIAWAKRWPYRPCHYKKRREEIMFNEGNNAV